MLSFFLHLLPVLVSFSTLTSNTDFEDSSSREVITDKLDSVLQDVRLTSYTDYNIKFKTNYAEIKYNAALFKTLRDSITIDGVNMSYLTENKLFGLTLHGTADEISLYDNYNYYGENKNTNLSENTLLKLKLPKVSKDEFGLTFILPDNSKLIKNIVGNTDSGKVSKIGDLMFQEIHESKDFITRGWQLDGGGVMIYTFYSEQNIDDLQRIGLFSEDDVRLKGLGNSYSIVVPFSRF